LDYFYKLVMKKYSNILFDFDKTLWDFEANSKETICEIFTCLDIKQKGITDFDAFYYDYEKINHELWDQYRKNKISKTELMVLRFYKSLLKYGIDDNELAKIFSDKYLELLPKKTRVFPYTHETLEYLNDKYLLHIVTNGFEEVQYKKIKFAGLEKYFTHIITSEKAHYKKPDKNFFEFALKEINAAPVDCLMIGDDIEVDLLGSRNAGIDQVFFNSANIAHTESFTYELKFRMIFHAAFS
jgi:putative hydrolase of the HAD superfamily